MLTAVITLFCTYLVTVTSCKGVFKPTCTENLKLLSSKLYKVQPLNHLLKMMAPLKLTAILTTVFPNHITE